MVRCLLSPDTGWMSLVEVHRSARSMDDQNFSPTQAGQNSVHMGSHFDHPASCTQAVVIVPHVHYDRRRFCRTPALPSELDLEAPLEVRLAKARGEAQAGPGRCCFEAVAPAQILLQSLALICAERLPVNKNFGDVAHMEACTCWVHRASSNLHNQTGVPPGSTRNPCSKWFR